MNDDPISSQKPKRHVAYKFRINEILQGKPILDNERFAHLEINNKPIIRINIIANVIDKFIQEGEKKYGSITLDDGSGQIRAKLFGEDVSKFSNLNQGDTILIIGFVRYWSNEIYISPETIKKKDTQFLLVRKLEIEAEKPKIVDRETLTLLKDKLLQEIKKAEDTGGISVESLITSLKDSPDLINQEIKKLLEEGLIYEPRPGRLRYLG